MKTTRTTTWLTFLTVLLGGAAIHADTPEHYWAQWRGPLHNGVAPHGDPPVEWSEEKNIRFKVEVPGNGLASPVVWGRRRWRTANGHPASSR